MLDTLTSQTLNFVCLTLYNSNIFTCYLYHLELSPCTLRSLVYKGNKHTLNIPFNNVDHYIHAIFVKAPRCSITRDSTKSSSLVTGAHIASSHGQFFFESTNTHLQGQTTTQHTTAYNTSIGYVKTVDQGTKEQGITSWNYTCVL